MRAVNRGGCHVTNGTRSVSLGAHEHEHTANISVFYDGARTFALCIDRAALFAVFCVSECQLISAFANGDALQAHTETRCIHHCEHRIEAAIFFTNEIANRTAFITIDHGAGW